MIKKLQRRDKAQTKRPAKKEAGATAAASKVVEDETFEESNGARKANETEKKN